MFDRHKDDQSSLSFYCSVRGQIATAPLKDTFLVGEILIKNMFEESTFSNFEKRTYENIEKIIAYRSKIEELAAKDPNSAINIRNKILKKKKNSM